MEETAPLTSLVTPACGPDHDRSLQEGLLHSRSWYADYQIELHLLFMLMMGGPAPVPGVSA